MHPDITYRIEAIARVTAVAQPPAHLVVPNDPRIPRGFDTDPALLRIQAQRERVMRRVQAHYAKAS